MRQGARDFWVLTPVRLVATAKSFRGLREPERMRIVAIETVNVEAFSNLVWIRIHTDDGIVGLGETFRNSQAVIAYLHETCAPYLLGKNPLHLERHHAALMSRVVNHFNG